MIDSSSTFLSLLIRRNHFYDFYDVIPILLEGLCTNFLFWPSNGSKFRPKELSDRPPTLKICTYFFVLMSFFFSNVKVKVAVHLCMVGKTCNKSLGKSANFSNPSSRELVWNFLGFFSFTFPFKNSSLIRTSCIYDDNKQKYFL